MSVSQRPKVGVAVLLINARGQILLGQRRASHGKNTWAPPGGHLEFGESLEACAGRELLEETGVKAKDFAFAGMTNDMFKEEAKHYVSIFMEATLPDGQNPINCEPHKTLAWAWFDKDTLPDPLFTPLENLMAQRGYGRLPLQESQ